jgi:hypothetical protein
VEFKIKNTDEQCNTTPNPISLNLKETEDHCVVDSSRFDFDLKPSPECNAGGEVSVTRSDNSLLEKVKAPGTLKLTDLNIEIVDENDNPILNLNQLVYTEQILDLTILASCNNLINLNNLIVSDTEPIGQPNGHYWFQPL